MAQYPTSIATLATKNAGDAITSAGINAIQAEVVAVETALGVNAGTWTTWTPTVVVTGATSATVVYAQYLKVGKIIYFYVKVDVVKGTSTATTGTISAPTTPNATNLVTGAGSITAGATLVPLYASASPGGIYISFGQAIQNNGSLYVSGFYVAA